MQTYTLEYHSWDDVIQVQFLVGDLLELVQEVNRWQRTRAITDDMIISIDLED